MAMEAGPPEECLLAETALMVKVLQENNRLVLLNKEFGNRGRGLPAVI